MKNNFLKLSLFLIYINFNGTTFSLSNKRKEAIALITASVITCLSHNDEIDQYIHGLCVDETKTLYTQTFRCSRFDIVEGQLIIDQIPVCSHEQKYSVFKADKIRYLTLTLLHKGFCAIGTYKIVKLILN